MTSVVLVAALDAAILLPMRAAWIRLTHTVNWRLFPVQAGILATFALVPVWYRFSGARPSFDAHYVTGFLIFYAMLWTIVAWLAMGLPGFRTLRSDFPRALLALALLALSIWAYASSGWALVRGHHPGVAQNGALQLGMVVLFAIAAASAPPPARAIVAVMVASVIWNGVIAALQTARQGAIGLQGVGEFPIGVSAPGMSVIQAGDVRWLRPYGLLPHPNLLGGVFAIGLLATAAWTMSQRRQQRWMGIAVFLFGLWAFLLTFSRAAWLGFAAGAIAMLPLILKQEQCKRRDAEDSERRLFLRLWRFLDVHTALKSLIVPLALAAITAAAFYVLYRPLVSARAGEGTEPVEVRSVSDRLVFAQFALRSVTERPLLGVGIANFPWRAVDYLRETDFDLQGDNVHHVLLSALAELGIVGYGLVVIALVCGVEAALRNLKPSLANEQVRDEKLAQIALFGGFMALTLIGLLDHYPWTLIQFQAAWWGLLAVSTQRI